MKNIKYHAVGTILKYHTVGTIIKYHTVGTILKYHTVGTILKYHTVGTILNSNIKIIKRGKIYTSSTQIHDHLLSWLDTGTSIKSGGVKLVLPPLLVKWRGQFIILCACLTM